MKRNRYRSSKSWEQEVKKAVNSIVHNEFINIPECPLTKDNKGIEQVIWRSTIWFCTEKWPQHSFNDVHYFKYLRHMLPILFMGYVWRANSRYWWRYSHSSWWLLSNLITTMIHSYVIWWSQTLQRENRSI